MNSKIHIGNFNIDSVFTEEFIGYLNEIDSKQKGVDISVDIYTDEGKYLPHFHITTEDNDIDCCIRLYQSGYFLHGEHNKPLPKKQLKKLVTWLSLPHKTKAPLTNWEVMDKIWTNAWGTKRRYTSTQPDYSKINDTIINTRVKVDIDDSLTYKCENNTSLTDTKIGKDENENFCIIAYCKNDNSYTISSYIKYVWYNKETGDTIYICRPKGNDGNIKSKDAKIIIEKVVAIGIFGDKNIKNYTELDVNKFYKK